MFTFNVSPDGGAPFTVRATSRDIVVWEKTTAGGRNFSSLAEASMTDFYGIAYVASRRQGLTDLDRRSWDDGVDIEDISEDAEPDPTPPEASTGP